MDGRCKEAAFSENVLDTFEKSSMLRIAIEGDKMACEATWTLFVAAARSYRYDSRLLPFPPRFASEQDGLDIHGLMSVINDTPSLTTVLRLIKEYRYEDVDHEVLELLYWVLVDGNDHWLRRVKEREVDAWFHFKGLQRPIHVFEVCQPLRSRSEKYFQDFSRDTPTKIAFYGNKLDCFYYIMNRGLTLGEQVLLTPSIKESLQNSVGGANWDAFSYRSKLSCVALCEYVNDPGCVQPIQVKKKGSDMAYDALLMLQRDLVRVRYLLFYANSEENQFVNWIYRHKVKLSMGASLLLLAAMKVSNSNIGHFWTSLINSNITRMVSLSKCLLSIK